MYQHDREMTLKRDISKRFTNGLIELVLSIPFLYEALHVTEMFFSENNK
jgi:hypothetical protein